MTSFLLTTFFSISPLSMKMQCYLGNAVRNQKSVKVMIFFLGQNMKVLLKDFSSQRLSFRDRYFWRFWRFWLVHVMYGGMEVVYTENEHFFFKTLKTGPNNPTEPRCWVPFKNSYFDQDFKENWVLPQCVTHTFFASSFFLWS